MAKLTARDIIELAQARAAQTRKVEVPELGATFTIRKLTMQEVQQTSQDATGDQIALSKLLFGISVVEPVFSPADVDALWGSGTPDVIVPVITAINEFNNVSTPKAVVEDSFPEQSA